MMSTVAYDAVILDYQMPETNGIDFLKLIRSRDDPIPFILFTGRGREEVVIEALNSGADFYLQKGGDPSSSLRNWSTRSRSRSGVIGPRTLLS